MKNYLCKMRPGIFRFRNRRRFSVGVFLAILLLFSVQLKIQAQTAIKVEGIVVSATDNSPIPGANIIVKGTQKGTVSDLDGKFTLMALPEDILTVTFIGYLTEEIAVGNQNNIQIALMEDYTKLDEVIVTGYSTMKKSDITSAQVSVSAEELQKSNFTSMDQALQGRAAGVYVTQNSGAPGGAVSVNIRGVNSISGSTEPMYIIDGIQIMGDAKNSVLSGINPDDIASMNILQGPQATAQYGSRAGNGVIVITTKNGTKGEAKISYNMNYSLQTLPKYLPTMKLNEFAEYMNSYAEATGQNPRDEFADPSVLGEGTNWQNELFQKAPMQKHQLSVNGGTDKTLYYLSTEFFKQDGVAYGSGFDRVSVRLNMENKTKKWLTVGTKLYVSETNEKRTFGSTGAGVGNGLISTALSQSPNIPVQNIDGTWGGPTTTQYQLSNPIALAEINKNDVKKRLVLGTFFTDIKILEGLIFRTKVSGRIEYENQYQFNPSYQFGGFIYDQTQANSRRESKNAYNGSLQNSLQYTRELGLHNIDVMAIHEAQETSWESIWGKRSNYINNTIEELSVGDKLTADNGSEKSSWAMESYIGILNYSYASKYFFSSTIRKDGSTNFGENYRWGGDKRNGFFPSVAVSYRISEESFMQSISSVNNLKLRFEVGITGNQSADNFAYLPNLKGTGGIWGSGFLTKNYPNPNLQWEETKQANIGVDLMMYNNRVEFVIDAYQKKINNLLMKQPLPAYLGTYSDGGNTGYITEPWVNIGEMENKGISITLNTVNIESPFMWRTGFTFTADRNKLTKLYNENAQIFVTGKSNLIQKSEVDESLWQFYIYQNDGIFQNLTEIENHARQSRSGDISEITGSWVGDYKFHNFNTDSVIDENDRANLGSPFPKFSLGISNSLEYKGFELYVFVTGVYGNNIYNYVRHQNESLVSGPGWNKFKVANEFARVIEDANGDPILENPETDISRLVGDQDPNGNNRANSFFLEDGSYIKVKDIRLTYNLPQSILNSITNNPVKDARLSIGVQNAFTFTNYKGYDPEVGTSYDDNDQRFNGVDDGRYPLSRVYTLNLQVGF